MTERTADASPKLKARIAGCLYLIVIVGPLFSPFFASSALIMRADAAATAARLLALESLYRLGAVDALIVLACDLALALIFYELLRPVSRSLALLAAFFRLAYVAINGANLINYVMPLLLLGGAGAFKPDQAQALALAFTRLRATGFDIALVFFGVHVAMLGYLLFRSTFFPRILGVLLAIGGLSYLVSSFANLISPAFGALLFPYILLPGGVAEISLAMWLVIVGVNDPRWKPQAE